MQKSILVYILIITNVALIDNVVEGRNFEDDISTFGFMTTKSLPITSTTSIYAKYKDYFTINSQPDLEIDNDNERLIEVFKSNSNDKIIDENNEKKYSQLKWYSYGSPKLIATNQTFFYPSRTGYYILIKFLSNAERQLIANELTEKYKINIKEKQIYNILADKFECSFETSCDNSDRKFFGKVKDLKRYPLRVDFKTTSRNENECLDLLLRSPKKDLIIFSCNLTVFSKSLNEAITEQGARREFDKTFLTSFELMTSNRIMNSEEESAYNENNSNKGLGSVQSLFSQRCIKGDVTINKTLSGHSGYVYALAKLPNGYLASGSSDYSIVIWNVDSSSIVQTLKGHSSSIRTLVMLPDGNLASGSSDGLIYIWNLVDGSIIRKFSGHSSAVRSLVVLPNGNLASGSDDDSIIIWNVNIGSKITTLTSSYDIISLAVLPNGLLASGQADSSIIIWNTTQGTVNKTLTGHTSTVLSLNVLPNGYLASGSADNTIIIWNVTQNSVVRKLKGHTGSVNSLTVLPNGNLASGSSDNKINVWNINDGSLIKTLTGHMGPVLSLVILPNGYLASGSDDNTIIVWNSFCLYFS